MNVPTILVIPSSAQNSNNNSAVNIHPFPARNTNLAKIAENEKPGINLPPATRLLGFHATATLAITPNVNRSARNEDWNDADNDEVELANKIFNSWINTFGLYNKIIEIRRLLKVKYQAFFTSRAGLILFPFAIVLINITVALFIFNYGTFRILPSIGYYNVIHLSTMIMTELIIISAIWQCRQIMRFQTAWNMAFSSITMKTLHRASKGSATKLGYFLKKILILYQVESFVCMMLANWNPIVSDIEKIPCMIPVYTASSLLSVSTPVEKISGETDFASIYNFGLPLADGILAGFGPRPLLNPELYDEFFVEGSGPLASLSVRCGDLLPYSGSFNFHTGVTSASFITSSVLSDSSFNISISMLFPVSVFQNTQITTQLTQQNCAVHSQLGLGIWTFCHNAYNWEDINGGEATKVILGNTILIQGSTLQFLASNLSKSIANPLPGSVLPSSQIVGNALISSMYNNVLQVFNNLNSTPSQSSSFCRFMSYGTTFNGNQYANLTYRGISLGIGSIFHQIFQQYDTSKTDSCNCYAIAGKGSMSIDSLFILVNDILIFVILLISFSMLYYGYYCHTIYDEERFHKCISIVLNEKLRIFYSAENVYDILLLRSGLTTNKDPAFHEDQLKFLDDLNVCYGEASEFQGSEKQRYWIGPKSKTRGYTPAQNTKNMSKDAIAKQKKDDEDPNHHKEENIKATTVISDTTSDSMRFRNVI